MQSEHRLLTGFQTLLPEPELSHSTTNPEVPVPRSARVTEIACAASR